MSACAICKKPRKATDQQWLAGIVLQIDRLLQRNNTIICVEGMAQSLLKDVYNRTREAFHGTHDGSTFSGFYLSPKHSTWLELTNQRVGSETCGITEIDVLRVGKALRLSVSGLQGMPLCRARGGVLLASRVRGRHRGCLCGMSVHFLDAATVQMECWKRRTHLAEPALLSTGLAVIADVELCGQESSNICSDSESEEPQRTRTTTRSKADGTAIPDHDGSLDDIEEPHCVDLQFKFDAEDDARHRRSLRGRTRVRRVSPPGHCKTECPWMKRQQERHLWQRL